MTECEVTQSFLDTGGILAVVFLFLLRDFYRWKFVKVKDESKE